MKASRPANQRIAVPGEPRRPAQEGCAFLPASLPIGRFASDCAPHEGIGHARSEVSVPADLSKVSATRLAARHPRTVVAANRLFNTKQGPKLLSNSHVEI